MESTDLLPLKSLVKVPMTEAQKRASSVYEAKNRIRRNEERKERNFYRYHSDVEYRLAIQLRMLETSRRKEILFQLPTFA
jgi:hypothetical protein